ncbi:TIGR03766 family XrtG-associated glycosyltransferase [Lactococcus lactis]|uniref:TIGR03766 family XrtG-associated glycosyltransferase n=1 Tax=Lactococcus lactis TaxID=1358 RepID=UPI0022DDF64E|nr:TIGR03766 family XrtG-associated glycosyltransferase [Lactococcus lactis]WBM78771.1 hypothetical protein OHI04_12585 [Lactococcus lactis]
MKKNLYGLGNSLIVWLFYILFSITYISVLLSDNFILGDNTIKGTSTTIGLFFFLITLLLLISSIFLFPKIKQVVTFIFVRHKIIIAVILFLVVTVFQVLFVSVYHPKIGWDVSALVDTLSNTDNPNNSSYFSLNYNNLPILLFMDMLSNFFKVKSWLFFDMVTLIMVDSSIVLSVATTYVVAKEKFATSLYIHLLLLSFFPWIIVPYTDTWVLPFVSGFLFFYFYSKKSESFWQKCLSFILFSVLLCIAYFIKPSAIIPAIAIIIIELLNLLRIDTVSFPKIIKKSLIILIAIATFFTSFSIIKAKINQQRVVEVNPELVIPAIHFMNMGISGDGGYNEKDALEMVKLATKSEKIDYSQKSLISRLSKLGPIGYLRFLLKKQINNTADGSFAWGREGNFIQGQEIPKANGIKGVIENYLLIYGEKISNFRFISQLIWLIILTSIFFGWKNRTQNVQIIRLGIIGAFIFLLLFEGGRSRYLIQFLPLFLVGASLLFSDSLTKIKGILHGVVLKRSGF